MVTNDEFCAIGTVITNPCFSHETEDGNKFCFFSMFAKRHSGTLDMFRCVIPHELTAEVEQGKKIEIYGEVRTRNYYEEDKRRTMVYVLVKEIYTARPKAISMNSVMLDGLIAKPPIVRDTPKGKRICDVILAVNHLGGRLSYIPCIFWGGSADIVGKKQIGDRLIIRGRLQSREYIKDGDLKVTYEVSAWKIGKEKFYEQSIGSGKRTCQNFGRSGGEQSDRSGFGRNHGSVVNS